MPVDPSSPPGPEKCPNCGAPLTEQAPQGLCPKCLFAGLAVPTEDGAGVAAHAPAQTPEELAPHFPQLEILECLGRGGMGVVYKARQKSLNRLVALKLLAPERVTDAKFAQRFTHEAQALAALNHPNIVTIHDFGQAGGFYFLLMEFVDGVNLRQAMKAGRFTPEQALAVVPPVCEALQYAHEHGIVHRDIKPENLLLDKEGRVKIADFGIAKMLGGDANAASPDQSQAGSADHESTLASAAGTPQYMAPEQKEHRVTDHRADIYSLGVVLYELLTGELPADKLQPPSRKVQIDVRLDEIVLRALEVKPELRYQTAGEFRTQVVTMTSSPEGPPVAPGVAAAPARFSRVAIVGGVWVLAAALAVITGQGIAQSRVELPPPQDGLLVFLIGLASIYVTCPFGTTILGWIAVTQIRRSAGKLHGLWLAMFDGLFFPLLALDALIVSIDFRGRTHIVGPGLTPGVTMAEQNVPALVVLLLLAVILIMDFLIIRAVWRAANKALNGSSTSSAEPAARFSQPSAASAQETAQRRLYRAMGYHTKWGQRFLMLSLIGFAGLLGLIPGCEKLLPLLAFLPFMAVAMLVEIFQRPTGGIDNPTVGYIAYYCACLSGVIPTVFYWLAPWLVPWLSSEGKEFMLWLTLVAGILAIVLGLAARRSWQGKSAMIIGGINLTIWLLFFVAGHFSMSNSPLAHPQGSKEPAAFGPVIEQVISVGATNQSFFNFERGFAAAPTDFDPTDQDSAGKLWKWNTAHQVDLFVRQRDGKPILTFSEMVQTGLNEEDFDRLTPEQLRNLPSLKLGVDSGFRPQEQSLINPGNLRGRHTWAFQTRFETIGLLQEVGVTSDPPGVKIRYKLLQKGGVTKTNHVATPDLLSEQPRLRFLAWREEWDAPHADQSRGAFHPDGSLASEPSELRLQHLIQPGSYDLSALSADKRRPRILHLWFSHPLMDQQSFREVTVLDGGGSPIPPVMAEDSSAQEADRVRDDLGWLLYTVTIGDAGQLPSAVTIRLRYTLGPWEPKREFQPGEEGTIALGNGSQFNAIGQNSEGKSFFSISIDMKEDAGRQFGVVAVTKDGRELQPTGSRSGGGVSETVHVQQFAFDAPLAEIAHFRLGTRPIRTVEFKGVATHPKPPVSPVFGPAIERTIETGGLQHRALNLASGIFESPSCGRDFVLRPDGADTLRAAGVDLYSSDDALGPDNLNTLDMRFWMEWSPKNGDKSVSIGDISVEEFPKLLAAGWNTHSGVDLRKVEPVLRGTNVHLFITRDGAQGVMQITGSKKPHGVKISYKLLQGAGKVAEQFELMPGTRSEYRSALRGYYNVRLPNGVEVSLVAVAVAPRLTNHWWQPDGAALKEQPADRLQFDSELPAGRAKPQNEVTLLIHHSWGAYEERPELWPGDEGPMVTHAFFPWVASSAGGVFLWRDSVQQQRDMAELAAFTTLPEAMAYHSGISIGPWERVAIFAGSETKALVSDASATFAVEGDSPKTLTVRHNIDRDNYHRRIVAHLKDGKTEVLNLSNPYTRDVFVTEQAVGPLPQDEDYVTLERRRCYWAEISDIVLHPTPTAVAAKPAASTDPASKDQTGGRAPAVREGAP